MPNGFPAFPQGRFPDDLPPTLFHPASPKVKPTEVKDTDAASTMSTSTFSSTVSLLKSKLPISYKDYKARKEAKEATRATVVIGEEPSSKPSKKSKALPKDPKTRKSSLKPDYDARQRTAEAYMVHAMMK